MLQIGSPKPVVTAASRPVYGTRWSPQHRYSDRLPQLIPRFGRDVAASARVLMSRRFCQADRVAACSCIVGAFGTARKPLASLGLGLTAALRVRSVRAVGAGSRLVSHPTRPDRAKEDT